ncbi:4'-phosphopantetheinyl transferase superfamily protein [Rhizobium sp. YK2]|uniref:4'-phosphopantetheinyl transferase family protein n=1 Tax=Rhizobium sp. YK2 TaxID=1860096 RepID=UPI00084C1C9C|nr:4'-phosphopantetheinyl transferase superfamily protein [Rhizobium sp. YK2]OEC93674.1 hypothetical protein A9Z06_33935 [Rhizobium sp. YK2]
MATLAEPKKIRGEGYFCHCHFEYGQGRQSDRQAIRLILPPQLANASLRRKADFVAGRACAGAALANLTGKVFEIPIGLGGQPIWPEGITGSITHSSPIAAAVVFQKSIIRNAGLDIEHFMTEPTAWEIERLILGEEERQLIKRPADRAQTVTAIFSAKEAIYKAIFPVVNRFVEFAEVKCTEIADHTLTFQVADPLERELGIKYVMVSLEIETQWVTTLCLL